jgi:hypothetical protein
MFLFKAIELSSKLLKPTLSLRIAVKEKYLGPKSPL